MHTQCQWISKIAYQRQTATAFLLPDCSFQSFKLIIASLQRCYATSTPNAA